jgi:hypothetical protein
VFERDWQLCRDQRADLVDEHYYVSQPFLLNNTHRYDSYDRSGPHGFLGEYAARASSRNYNNFFSALSEAAYITGLERNSDVVEMASYAPLLANADYVNWSPDLVWFDNARTYGTPSYWVQRLFSRNRGDRLLPTTLKLVRPEPVDEVDRVAGKSGNAIRLDGLTQYARLPGGIVSGLNDFTISAWVNPQTVDTWARVFDFGSSTDVNMFLTVSAGSAPRFAITMNGGGNESRLSGTAPLPAGEWTHLAVTRSGTTGTLYVNGVAVATDPNMTLSPASLGATTNNWIGKSQYGADPLLNAAVDEFQIYDRGLSAAEVQSLITSAGAGNLASYRFDESGGTIAADSSGNGRDATLVTEPLRSTRSSRATSAPATSWSRSSTRGRARSGRRSTCAAGACATAARSPRSPERSATSTRSSSPTGWRRRAPRSRGSATASSTSSRRTRSRSSACGPTGGSAEPPPAGRESRAQALTTTLRVPFLKYTWRPRTTNEPSPARVTVPAEVWPSPHELVTE